MAQHPHHNALRRRLPLTGPAAGLLRALLVLLLLVLTNSGVGELAVPSVLSVLFLEVLGTRIRTRIHCATRSESILKCCT